MFFIKNMKIKEEGRNSKKMPEKPYTPFFFYLQVGDWGIRGRVVETRMR